MAAGLGRCLSSRVPSVPRIEADNLPEHRRLVHERVFSAFAALMAERSYDAITMAHLAERAGLGRTAIYHHFRDKEAVVIAFAGEETERYLADLRAALESVDDPVARLRIYVRRQLASSEQFHVGLGPQLYGMLPGSSRAGIREHVAALEQVLRDVLADGVAQQVFAIENTDATVALVHACLSARQLAEHDIEEFILRAVEAPRPH